MTREELIEAIVVEMRRRHKPIRRRAFPKQLSSRKKRPRFRWSDDEGRHTSKHFVDPDTPFGNFAGPNGIDNY